MSGGIPQGKIGAGSLAFGTFLAVVVLANVPAAAQLGPHLVWMMLLGVVFLMLPVIFVASDMVTTFPRNGGVYLWVTKAMGPRLGFLAIWFQWLPRVIVVPTIITLIASAGTYAFDPKLAQSGVFMLVTILIVTWISVWLNLKGVRDSTIVTTVGAIVGNIGPALLLIGLGIYFAFQDGTDPMHAASGAGKKLDLGAVTLALASFIGMEVTANFVENVDNPNKNYRRALLWAAFFAVVVMIGAPMAVENIVEGKVGIVSGIMATFDAAFQRMGASWLLAPIGIIIAVSTITQCSAFMLAPAVGMHAAAVELELPKALYKLNDNDAPSAILVIEGLVITVLSIVFVVVPDTDTAFAITLSVAVICYVISYILMFISTLIIRRSHRGPRPCPGGKPGLWGACIAGIASSVALMIVGFIPPPNTDAPTTYVVAIAIGFALVTLLPFAFPNVRRPPEEKRRSQLAEELHERLSGLPSAYSQAPGTKPPPG